MNINLQTLIYIISLILLIILIFLNSQKIIMLKEIKQKNEKFQEQNFYKLNKLNADQQKLFHMLNESLNEKHEENKNISKDLKQEIINLKIEEEINTEE